ncbi:hypothetical protein LSAT2_032384 [Lamellibrachia satsuma]|nr:hypothetical protein LSAT2_032384 [Lamellibrachia satsuma]
MMTMNLTMLIIIIFLYIIVVIVVFIIITSSGNNNNNNKYLVDSRLLHDTMTRDVSSVTQHPVALYRLRRRLGTQWPPVLDVISETELMRTVPSLTATLAKFRKILKHEADLASAVTDLLRLQRLYSLRTHHLTEGRVLDAFSAPLDEEEIFEIGQALVDLDENRLAIEWLEVGVGLCNHSDHGDKKTHFMNVIASSYMRMNRYVEAKALFETLVEKAPNNRAAHSSLKLLNSKLAQQKQQPRAESDIQETSEINGDEDFELWQHFCEGHDYVEHKVEDDTQLLCYKKYLNISDEYIRLEEVMLQPRLVLVHDVFTHRETDLMIREATAEVSLQQPRAGRDGEARRGTERDGDGGRGGMERERERGGERIDRDREREREEIEEI